ncbi:hypothetical protein B0F90DRAFT_1657115 [Multifurca ochricompacta]|uniref:Uncharacterized protein n=1 Tax=Multifurca ochricompacta TaxID=376703 RepID=A0AAD4LST2_9AGAM|nr:hypothetical protein B0F90DRAFT_1657115 [Multifurca ochricompacta]
MEQIVCCSHEDIIHVHHYFTSEDKVAEDVVHHGLKGGRRVGEAKEHDVWFKESLIGFKRRFALISFLNSDVIVSPSDIHFGEHRLVPHGVNKFRDEGKWIGILYGVGIYSSVVLNGSKFSIFLLDEEEG